jgi:hypothetical protein
MDVMKLTYETGTATLIQFIVLSFFNIVNGTNSVVTTCHRDSDGCISNLLVSIIFYILVVSWFGCVWILGYLAQERRSKRLAQLLICAELLIALVALFNTKHHADFISFTTSVIDMVLAIWIITLAFRLMRAGGGRVVGRGRQRPRRRKAT